MMYLKYLTKVTPKEVSMVFFYFVILKAIYYQIYPYASIHYFLILFGT